MSEMVETMRWQQNRIRELEELLEEQKELRKAERWASHTKIRGLEAEIAGLCKAMEAAQRLIDTLAVKLPDPSR